MDRKALLTLLVACLCMWPVAGRAGGEREESPGDMFAGAFQRWRTPDQRIAIMTRIVCEHPESRWADDALWVLAQVATLRGNTARSIVLRQQLVARNRPVSLEEFTRSRQIYRRSRLRDVEFLLEQSGHLFTGQSEETSRFNAVPMVLHEQLGVAYEELGMSRSAAREYRMAAHLGPAGNFLAGLYRRRADRLDGPEEKDENQDEAAKQLAAPETPAGPQTEMTRKPAEETAETQD